MSVYYILQNVYTMFSALKIEKQRARKKEKKLLFALKFSKFKVTVRQHKSMHANSARKLYIVPVGGAQCHIK